MAQRACMGLIKAGPTPDAVGEVRSWEMEETADVQDSSIMGNCAKRQTVTGTQTNLTLTCYYESADAGQTLLAPGAEVDLEIYPEGEQSSLVYFTGTALITSRRRAGDVAGLIEYVVNATVQGSLTEQTVV